MVQVNVDARPLLQRAIESEITRQYSANASPEFTPTSSPPSTPLRTSPPPSSNATAVIDPVLQELQQVSKRLAAFSSTPCHSTVTRNAKRNAKKRGKDRARGTLKEHVVDPLKERRKVRSSVSNKYARPRMIRADFVVTALTIARYANVGISRPASRTVPSFAELQKANPDFTVIRNPEL